LDRVLGVEEEDDTLNRDEMAAMVNIIRDERSRSIKHSAAVSTAATTVGNDEGGRRCYDLLCCCCPTTSDNANNDSISRKPGYTKLGNVVMHSEDHCGNYLAPGDYSSDYIAENASGGSGFEPIPEDEEELSHAEMNVISGVLMLKNLKVRDICIPMNEVNMLSSDQLLTPEVIDAIDKVGHTRLPVFRGQNINDIIGFFIVKRLMTVSPEKNVPLSSFCLNAPIVVG
jgi:hypothetical protein